MSIIEADSICYNHGAYLAEIESETEYNFVVDFVNKVNIFNTRNNNWIMLGSTNHRREERWEFVKSGGYNMTFFDWALTHDTVLGMIVCILHGRIVVILMPMVVMYNSG